MDNIFEIKEEYKAVIVGFNGSGLPLGCRNDLDKLAMLAYVNRGLAKYFVKLPSQEEIATYRGEKLVESTSDATQVLPVPPVPTLQTPAAEHLVKDVPAKKATAKKRSKKEVNTDTKNGDN